MKNEAKVFKGTDGEELVYKDHFSNFDPQPRIFNSEQLNWKARLTLRLIERWGLLTAVQEGEDSQGRAKLNQESPKAIVDRAISIAEITVDRLHGMGWVERNPSYEDVYGMEEDKE